MPADADRGYDTNLPELTDFQREVLVSNDTTLPFCLPFSEHENSFCPGLPRDVAGRCSPQLEPLVQQGVEAF